MLIVISPAKTLDFEGTNKDLPMTRPRFLEKSKTIMKELQKYDIYSLEKLMKISNKLAKLNVDRFKTWTEELESSKQCLLAFKGDVYRGMDVGSFTDEEFFYSNDHLRILSGLYGVLKPLDGVNPYRLEMGTSLKIKEHKNLYEFWGDELKNSLIKELKDQKSNIIINLASKEYFKAIEKIDEEENIKVITPVFKELRNGEYRIISLNAKKARGLMTRYIIKNKFEDIEDIKNFNLEGYEYNEELSNEKDLVFIR
ncbi:peroxide stress protein YaaA [Clostridium carnis]